MDDGFDEYDLLEAEYADQLEILDELEGAVPKEPLKKPEDDYPDTAERDCDLPDMNQREPRRRKLFLANENDHLTGPNVEEDEFENDLGIDENELENLFDDDISLSPLRKKPRLLTTSRQHSLPTTLDCDRDAALEKVVEERHKNCLSTPRLLEKIRNYRDRRNNTKEFVKTIQAATDLDEVSEPIQLTKVLIRPPMHCQFMSATSSDGQRVYMRMREEKSLKKVQSVNEMITRQSQGLLPQTMTELRQIIFDERQYDVIEESRRITDEIRREALQLSASINESLEESPERLSKKEDKTNPEKTSKAGLWVNKYAPTRYTHLLSDESVNRALLKWLKLWDGIVFGREPPIKKKADNTNVKEKQQNSKFQTKWKSKSDPGDLDEELDENKRPKFKAALLCGPPGLGKTTLAHVVAKHAGYHVVEMNASDDRTAEAFQKKLDETTQMQSVLGTREKPNCLIVDEIDGAPQAAINILLNAMNRSSRPDAKKKRSKGGAAGILQRPIICICNDLYVPALRQLRQHSFVLQFPPTTTAKLASRLRQMCAVQRLQCDMTILLALCEKSSNDIRTCINTLQFLQSKEERLSLESIHNLPIGQKDQHQSIFYVWNEIFQQPKSQRKIDQNSLALQQLSEGRKVTQFSVRFYHILNVVIANGEYEKVLQGVFENFLSMKFKDSGMRAVNKAYEWLALYDHLNEQILSRQEWILMQYIPYLFVVFHLLFSCISPPRTQFPQSVQENRQKLQKSEHLLTSMFGEMAPDMRCFASPTVALMDTIPHLLAIMTPNIRAVNMQLYSAAEKKQLQDLVSSMLSYNLTFRQERNQDAQYNYVLEPDMTEVCHFKHGDHAPARKELSYAIKQIIAKEVEMERMRRMEKLKTGKNEENNKENESNTSSKAKSQKSTNKTTLPNHLQRLEDNINTIKVPVDKPVVNFFSRFTKIKRVDEDGKEKISKKAVEIRDPGIGNSQLWYKYNEGFSNAVRRVVYIKDWL